jgi:hypothetical protein
MVDPGLGGLIWLKVQNSKWAFKENRETNCQIEITVESYSDIECF